MGEKGIKRGEIILGKGERKRFWLGNEHWDKAIIKLEWGRGQGGGLEAPKSRIYIIRIETMEFKYSEQP